MRKDHACNINFGRQYPRQLLQFVMGLALLSVTASVQAAVLTVQQSVDSHYLDLNQSQSLNVSLSASGVTTPHVQPLQIEFSNPVNLSNIPAECVEDSSNNRLDCSVQIPASTASTTILSPSFSFANAGQTEISVTLLDVDNTGDEETFPESSLLVFSGNVVRVDVDNRLADADALLAVDVNSDNAPDLMVARDLVARPFINSGTGTFTDSVDNRYVALVSGSRAQGHRITNMLKLNKDGDNTPPEIFVSTNTTVSYLVEQQTTTVAISPTSDLSVTVPAGVDYYSIGHVHDRYVNPDSVVPVHRIAVDLDADIASDSAYWPGNEIISVSNSGAPQQITRLDYESGKTAPRIFSQSYGRQVQTDVDTGDFDGDSRLDIVFSGTEQGRIFFAGAPSQFDRLTQRYSSRRNIGGAADYVAVIDVDQDSDADIVFAANPTGQSLGRLSIFLNDGQGRFTLSTKQYATGIVDDLTAVDINNDNNPELVVAQDGGVTVYETSSTELLTLYPAAAIISPPLQFADFDADQIIDIAGDRVILSSQLVPQTDPDPQPDPGQPPGGQPDPSPSESNQQQLTTSGGATFSAIGLLAFAACVVLLIMRRSNQKKSRVE